ncbi:MAG: T9SS type A sorting domain-containing protein [Bacteroidetes bacterium]|nr:T9SS type A sorting domain-containing protein [Bacteroidota bacterium]
MNRRWCDANAWHAVALLSVLFLHSTVACDKTPVAVEPASKTVSIAETFALNVTVQNVIDLHAASVTLAFNRQILTYSKVELGTFLTGALMLTSPVKHGPVFDTVVVDQAVLGPGTVSGSGVLLVFTFTATNPGVTPIDLPSPLLFGGTAGNISIPVSSIAGEVTVEGQVPISLSSFIALPLAHDRGVRLEWTTLSEINNYGFWIDRRRSDETEFREVPSSFVAGNGTTLQPCTYSFVDNTIPTSGRYEYRLRQVDQDGTEHVFDGVWVDMVVTDVANESPGGFRLMQNYPNPFNPSTIIEYNVATAEGSSPAVSLRVYDALGREVAVLVDENQAPGRYSVTFNAGGLSSGVYYYRLTAGARSAQKALMLLR